MCVFTYICVCIHECLHVCGCVCICVCFIMGSAGLERTDGHTCTSKHTHADTRTAVHTGLLCNSRDALNPRSRLHQPEISLACGWHELVLLLIFHNCTQLASWSPPFLSATYRAGLSDPPSLQRPPVFNNTQPLIRRLCRGSGRTRQDYRRSWRSAEPLTLHEFVQQPGGNINVKIHRVFIKHCCSSLPQKPVAGTVEICRRHKLFRDFKPLNSAWIHSFSITVEVQSSHKSIFMQACNVKPQQHSKFFCFIQLQQNSRNAASAAERRHGDALADS